MVRICQPVAMRARLKPIFKELRSARRIEVQYREAARCTRLDRATLYPGGFYGEDMRMPASDQSVINTIII